MKLKKLVPACTLALATMFGASAQAQISGDTIKIGFITDLSGLYADIDGPAGAEAIRMAIADMGGAVAGKKIEVLVADHQNKPDVAGAKAREWFDTQGVDMLIGGTNSGTSLAMAKVAQEKKKLFISVGAATSALTNEQCSPYTVHYAYDTTALAKGTGNAVVKAGGKSWYFLTADYAFGTQLQNDSTTVVKAAGGTVVGSVRAPLNGERLLVVPAAGAAEQGADPRSGQRRRRHDQLDQGGQRVRHHQDDEARRPADVHQRRPLARPEGDARDVPHRQLVLEPRRRVARLEPQVLRQVQAHAVVAAGGRLLGGAAVPERGQGDRQRRLRTRSWRR